MVKSVNQNTNRPSVTAVKSTPRVDKISPSLTVGFTVFQLVSSPPENKIKFNDTIPMNCAISGLSNLIPARPSEPAIIPIVKKSNNVGRSEEHTSELQS